MFIGTKFCDSFFQPECVAHVPDIKAKEPSPAKLSAKDAATNVWFFAQCRLLMAERDELLRRHGEDEVQRKEVEALKHSCATALADAERLRNDCSSLRLVSLVLRPSDFFASYVARAISLDAESERAWQSRCHICGMLDMMTGLRCSTLMLSTVRSMLSRMRRSRI